MFVCVVLESDVVGSLESSAQIHRILKVAFFSGFTKRYDDYDSINEERSSSLEAHPEGIPFMPLIKLLSTGSFYYSPHLDITRSTQTRGIDLKMGYPSNSLFDRTDNHFVWNKHLLKPLLKIRETEMDDCEISEVRF